MRLVPLRTATAVYCFIYSIARVANVSAAPSPSFSELMQRAQASAPRLLESAAAVEAAAGRARQAAAWPNPNLSVDVEDFSGTGPYRGTAQAQTTLALSEPLELAGQRSARVHAGRADLTAARARDLQVRADFGFELALAYATAEVAQSRAGLLAADLDRTQEDVRQARALVDAGKEGELRAVQAEAAAAGARADLAAATADATESLAHLSSLVGVAEPYSSVGPSLLVRILGIQTHPSDAPPVAPAVVAARADREAAARRIQVERKRVLPIVSLSIGARRFTGQDATALVGGVSVSLPLFDWNRGAIAAARADALAAEARLAGANLDAAASWHAAMSQATAASARQSAADQAESAAREAYRLARVGYEAGRTSLLELLSTRRALTDAGLRSLDARLARVRTEASIARLAGRIPFGDQSE